MMLSCIVKTLVIEGDCQIDVVEYAVGSEGMVVDFADVAIDVFGGEDQVTYFWCFIDAVLLSQLGGDGVDETRASS